MNLTLLLGLAALALLAFVVAAGDIRSRFAAFALSALALFVFASPALAQTATDAASTAVSVPYGSWIAGVGELVLAITGAAIAWLFRKLPASVLQVLTTMQAEQLLNKAIAYAVNAVEGATAGKTLSVNVGNAVLAQALTYVLDHAPGWLVSWLGGTDAIAQKIIARLNLGEDASVTTTDSGVAITSTAAGS